MIIRLAICEKYVMYLHVYAKMQINHSCTSKMRKTPHIGQFSNGTLLFYLCESKQGRTKGSYNIGSLDFPSNKIFHGTIRHIRSGFPSYARTLCALTLLACALKFSFFPQTTRDWNVLSDSLISSAEVSVFAEGF